MIDAIVLLSTQGFALRGHDKIIGSFHNRNLRGIIELLSKYDPILATHVEKYENKGHTSPSYLSHSIFDELINIMANSVRKIIVKEMQDSRYSSILVDWTTDITQKYQLCITFRYVLPSSPVERFVTSVLIKSRTRIGIAEVIPTFLQKNSIDVKYCRVQSYGNAGNMSGKYKGVKQRIKDVCSYAEFCPCFAHSLNLFGKAQERSYETQASCCQTSVKYPLVCKIQTRSRSSP